MVIDSHQHFWLYESSRLAWITDSMAVLKRNYLPADLELELKCNRVDACVAVQAEASENETRFLLYLADSSPWICGVVGWIDLTSPTVSQTLEGLGRQYKLCGFRHIVQDEKDDRFLLRDDFTRGIEALGEFGYTFDILIYSKHLPAALELVERFPEQKFVIDHLAKPDIRNRRVEPWASEIRAMAQHSHVYCKLSGLVTETNWRGWSPGDFRPYLDIVFEAFGQKRLMYGSDWPVCLLASSYSGVKKLIESYVDQFPVEARGQIFGETAKHFYGLETSTG